MANHKDAIKRSRQALARRLRNRHFRTMVRNRVKAVRAAVESGDLALARDEFRKAQSVIHRVAQKGVIHRNQAARRISRLNALVKKLALGASA